MGTFVCIVLGVIAVFVILFSLDMRETSKQMNEASTVCNPKSKNK